MANKSQQDELDLETILDEDEKVGSKEGAVITIEDKDDDGKTATEKSNTGDQQESAEETITKLRQQLEDRSKIDDENRSRIQKLEDSRAEEQRKAVSAVEDAYKARETSLETSILASKSDLDSIKRQLKEAREKGDIDAEIDLEEKLADTRYNFNALNWQKSNIADEKKRREDAIKNAPVQSQQGSQKYSPKAQAWINEHPRFNNDDDYQATVFSSHDLAVKRGMVADSQAYFDFIDQRLDRLYPSDGDGGQPNQEQTQPQRQQPRQQTTSVAAPPSRTQSSQRMGTNGRQVRLTADQLEAAEFMGLTPQEYAKELMEMDKEKGRLN